MITFIFTVGTANILLGYALAVYVRRILGARPAFDAVDQQMETTIEPVPGTQIDGETSPETSIAKTGPSTAESPQQPAEEGVREVVPADEDHVEEEIPKAWLDRLEAESIHAKTLVEATAQIMRLEIGKYRDALVRLDDEFRADGLNPSRIRRVVDRLVKLNRAWLTVQEEAADHLNSRSQSLADFGDLGISLGETLAGQVAELQEMCQRLEQLDTDAESAADELTELLTGSIDLAHTLRDCVSDTLLTTLKHEGRMGDLPSHMRQDSATPFQSKTGFAVAIDGWWQADPGRSRLSSAALLDISGIGQMNRARGTRFGDRLISAAASLLNDVLRKNRGFEIVSRINGQQFLLFFGDTGPRNATSASERMRQSFARAKFECEDDELLVSISCAVTEVLKDDDTSSLIKRLQGIVAAAKQSSHNCTMLDEGSGPEPVTPPDYQLPRRVIAIGES